MNSWAVCFRRARAHFVEAGGARKIRQARNNLTSDRSKRENCWLSPVAAGHLEEKLSCRSFNLHASVAVAARSPGALTRLTDKAGGRPNERA